MRTQHSETKSASFHAFSVPTLEKMEKRILKAFSDRGVTLTRDEIADKLNRTLYKQAGEKKVKVSSVCGRVNSLVTKGVLVVRGREKSKDTGRLVELVGLPVPTQLDLLG